MRRLLPALLTLALVAPAVLADDAPKSSEAFKKLEKEFLAKIRSAKRDDVKGILAEYAPRFLEFAEKNAKAPSGLDAAIYVLRMSRMNTGKETPAAKALALIEKNYVGSEKMAS